jgi:hypothetical protein
MDRLIWHVVIRDETPKSDFLDFVRGPEMGLEIAAGGAGA